METQRLAAAARQQQKDQLAARVQQLGEKQKDMQLQLQKSEAVSGFGPPSPSTPQPKNPGPVVGRARPSLTPLSASASQGKDGLGAPEGTGEEAKGQKSTKEEARPSGKQTGGNLEGEGPGGEDWGWWSGTGSDSGMAQPEDQAPQGIGSQGQEEQFQQSPGDRQEQERQDQTLGKALKSMLSWGGKNKRFAKHIDVEGWSKLEQVSKELKISPNRARKIVSLGAGRFQLYEPRPGDLAQNPSTVYVRAYHQFFKGPLAAYEDVPVTPPSIPSRRGGGRRQRVRWLLRG